MHASVGNTEVGFANHHRQEGAGGGVGEHFAGTECEQVANITAMLTLPVTMVAHRTPSDEAADAVGDDHDASPVARSAIAPAHSPNISQGRRSSSPASATRNALRVCDATSSGPAASAIPSPMFDTQDDPSNKRKPVPSRGGMIALTIRCTKDERTPTVRLLVQPELPAQLRQPICPGLLELVLAALEFRLSVVVLIEDLMSSRGGDPLLDPAAYRVV